MPNPPSEKETEILRPKPRRDTGLDHVDRRILSALIEDAGLSYAELGQQVNLSAPAVFERVKRLRASGALKKTEARVCPQAVGKPMLTFVHVDTIGWGKSQALMSIRDFPEVEEIHSVAGDTCMLLKVRTENTQALEHLLALLYDMPGVKMTRSYVVLSTYLERTVQADCTAEWPTPMALP